MTVFAFVDLDDTLFQTREKCPPDLADEALTVAALDRAGAPLSYMTSAQARFWGLLSERAIPIPVTGRNKRALDRVLLPFPSWRVTSHGAMVWQDADTPDPDWLRERSSHAKALAPLLHELAAGLRQQANGAYRVNVVEDAGLDLYISLKAHDQDRGIVPSDAVLRAQAWVRERAPSWDHHHNGRNCAFLPPGVSKRRAVAFVRERLAQVDEALILAAGDSFSDLPFMAQAHYMIVPPQSQAGRPWTTLSGPPRQILNASLPRTSLAESTRSSSASAGTDLGTFGLTEAEFSGSYDPDDVRFLLKPIEISHTPTAEKEEWIQSGKRHYSEMISHEAPPSDADLALFDELTARHALRLAGEVLALAQFIAEGRSGGAPVIVSLARAGTPIGALLVRALRHLGVAQAPHYSISIIRDRGLDENALRYILRHHPAEAVAFVDGWTAKGAIQGELRRAIARFNDRYPRVQLRDSLHVVLDLSGQADVAATADDYGLPSGMLNACASGLVSRSILNQAIGPDDFHGCAVYDHLAPWDRSRGFLEAVTACFPQAKPPPLVDVAVQARNRVAMEAHVAELRARFGIENPNGIKPGLCEATRALLRREPGLLLLREPDHPDVAFLRRLAERRNTAIEVWPDMPGLATALLRRVV